MFKAAAVTKSTPPVLGELEAGIVRLHVRRGVVVSAGGGASEGEESRDRRRLGRPARPKLYTPLHGCMRRGL